MLVGPEYLGKTNLPFVSDIFYHDKLFYSMPTGFHPLEFYAVTGFQDHCSFKQIAFPELIWKLYKDYFEIAKETTDCISILEPFRPDKINFIQLSYPRELLAIKDAEKIIDENPDLYKLLENSPWDIRLAARELFSHLFLEIFMESGYNGVIEYIQEKNVDFDTFMKLLIATIVNRLRFVYAHPKTEVVVYQDYWGPIISKCAEIMRSEPQPINDEFRVEHFNYKLFEKILYPIFGRCDSVEKSSAIANITTNRNEEIKILKKTCYEIASDVVLLNTLDQNLKQRLLTKQIEEKILNPLTELVQRPQKDMRQYLLEWGSDSTVIAALLVATQNDAKALGVAVTAGAISTLVRNLFRPQEVFTMQPSKFLYEEIKAMRVEYNTVYSKLMNIQYNQVSYY